MVTLVFLLLGSLTFHKCLVFILTKKIRLNYIMNPTISEIDLFQSNLMVLFVNNNSLRGYDEKVIIVFAVSRNKKD